jgi:hypothetical protein
MTIAEQLARAKTDYDEVYTAGYEKGKAEGGGSEQSAFLNYATSFNNVFEVATFPAEGYELTVDLPSLKTGVDRIISYAKNLTKFTLKGNNNNNAISCQYAFRGGNMLKVIDFSGFGSGEGKGVLKATYLNSAFSSDTVLESILGEIDFSSVVNVSEPFGDCYALKDVRFTPNTLSKTMSMSTCRSLSAESFMSIVRGLSDTASGQTLSLRKATVNIVFETSEGANDGSESTEWAALVGEKPNWTISLI